MTNELFKATECFDEKLEREAQSRQLVDHASAALRDEMAELRERLDHEHFQQGLAADSVREALTREIEKHVRDQHVKLECVYSSASSATEAHGMRLRGEITQFAMDNGAKQREDHQRLHDKLEELGNRLGQLTTEHEKELETVGTLFEGLEQRMEASLLQVSSEMGSTVQASLRSFRSKLGEDLVRALGEVETRHKDLFQMFLSRSEP